MDIVVNGEKWQVQPGMTLADLLQQKGLLAKLIVVELNGTIVKKEDWTAITFQAGDRLEIITLVGGG